MKDPNNTRDTVPRRGSPLWIYLTAVTGIGAVALVVALSQLTAADLKAGLADPLYWLVGSFIV